MINKLLLEGFLIVRGGDWDSNPRNNRYQTINFEEEKAIYGVYDFCVEGFPLIRQTFEKSVFLFQVKLEDRVTIGTGFLLKYQSEIYVITAKHNILKNKGFKIQKADSSLIIPIGIWITCDREFEPVSDGLIDIAILNVPADNIVGITAFQVDSWKILDSVLTIGYPPIVGFDAIQFAETAAIAALKSTTGQITAEGNSYIGKQDYFLISARVKGGNSGGPVVNKSGKVIGIITDVPEQDNQLDSMGYGIVTPVETITKVIDGINQKTAEINVKQMTINKFGDDWIEVK